MTANGGFGKGYGITIASGITSPDTYYKPNSTVHWMDAHNYDLWGNALTATKVDAATMHGPMA